MTQLNTFDAKTTAAIANVVRRYLSDPSNPLPKRFLGTTEDLRIRLGKTTTTSTYPSSGNTFEVKIGQFDFNNTSTGSKDLDFDEYVPEEIRICRTLDGSYIEEDTDVFLVLHHEKWYIIPFGSGGSGGTIEGVLTDLRIETEGYYIGLKVATVEITEAPCGREDLMPEVIFTEGGLVLEPVEVDVVDHSGCIFDHSEEDLDGVRIWATERISVNPGYDPRETIPNPEDLEGPEIPNPNYDPEKYTPCHWCADDRCCVEADFPEEEGV